MQLPPTGPPIIVDTGASRSFFSISCPVTNKVPATPPITISLANASTVQSSHTAELDMPQLRPQARQGHIVPSLAHTLISAATLCDAGYALNFTAQHVTIRDCATNDVVLTGTRDAASGLWHLEPLQTLGTSSARTIHLANRIGDPTEADLVAYAHHTMFSPTTSALEFALRNNFLTNFPGLSLASLRRNPPNSIYTAKGHLDQVRKNVKSTKTPPTVIPNDDNTTAPPEPDNSPQQITTKSHHCFVSIMEPTGQIYSDQTGKFIAPSTNGNNYIMIVYDYDSNHIFAIAFRNRTAHCIRAAYQTIHQRLCKAGLKPKLQRLDNECSNILKQFLTESDIDYQLVPPGIHRRNSAERAIRTFQNHFIAGLCSADKDFPIHLWDGLIPQAEITLNLLRASRINPNLSAHAQVNGHFDFNRTPLGPVGCRVIAHEKPANRNTWAPHGLDGWYIGPALESYRCYKVWIYETRAIRICDTLTWFPTKVQMPHSSSLEIIATSLRDITNALTNPSPRSPIAPLTDSLTEALRANVELVHNIILPRPGPAPPLRVAETTQPTPVRESTAPPGYHAQPLANKPGQPTLIPIEPDAPPQPPHHQPTVSQPQRPTNRVPADPKTPSPTYDDLVSPRVRANKRKARRQQLKPTPTAPRAPPTVRPTNTSRRSKRTPKPSAKAKAAQATIDTINDQLNLVQILALHGTAINPDTGQSAEYRELAKCSDGAKWIAANDEEIGRMCSGLGPDSDMPTGTGTLDFIDFKDLPRNKKATYVRVVAADRPEKPQPRRIRWTLGGDRIDYPGNKTTKTADLTTAKLLLNSVISTPNGRFMTIDLGDFYLNTDLPEPEFVRIPVSILSDRIITLYNLGNRIHNGHVYCRVNKGMYGLPQAGKLANDDLAKHLAPHGYIPCPITPGLWKDTTSDLMFSLVVDDFGVRYTSKPDVERLLTILQRKYRTSTDWTGSRYVGLTIVWDYTNGTVDISMPGYVERALQRFMHTKPARHESSPHDYNAPVYGSRQQYETQDTTPYLDLNDKQKILEIVGVFLYYARAVDLTMIPALGTIASKQNQPTEHTLRAATKFLNYAASNPDATVRYHASGMQLYIESDASYLCETKARSRAAGIHYLGPKPDLKNLQTPPRNGTVAVLSKILRNVVSSASEAELAALFLNGQEAVPIRNTLEELGHIQGPTPIVTDNITAHGIANDSIKQKRSKAMDMRFFWIRNRVSQGQFVIYWRPGKTNLGDYVSKHHSGKHHRRVRPAYLHTPSSNRYAPLADDA
jgi:hypothetical protein